MNTSDHILLITFCTGGKFLTLQRDITRAELRVKTPCSIISGVSHGSMWLSFSLLKCFMKSP
jgi:hypothetical protein